MSLEKENEHAHFSRWYTTLFYESDYYLLGDIYIYLPIVDIAPLCYKITEK